MFWEELGELTAKQSLLVSVLEFAKLEEHLPYAGRFPDRPPEDRIVIARAFVHQDGLRHGEHAHPAGSTRNRSNGSPSLWLGTQGGRARRIHLLPRLCWICRKPLTRTGASGAYRATFWRPDSRTHIPRFHSDCCAWETGKEGSGRGKEAKKTEASEKREKSARKHRLGWNARLRASPFAKWLPSCPGPVMFRHQTKQQRPYTNWIGFKLHIDAANGGIPVSCLLTSAALHDSQVAIPLAKMTYGRVTSLYDMMDSAYDAPQIKAHSRSLGHVPVIDTNPRSKASK